MRARWEALHAGLAHSVRTLHAETAFTTIQRHHPRFEDAVAVVDYLTNRDGDRDEKDAILGTLATLVHRREAHRLAGALLWLGLWPGLDAVFRRRARLRSSPGASDELVSELTDAFTREVASLDLSRVSRVAATLVRSTERRLLLAGSRAAQELPLADVGDDEALAVPSPGARESRLGLPTGRSPEDDVAALRARLERVVGADAELLVSVAVLGETQGEAGTRLGLSAAAARKRFQRALARARPRLALSLSLSHSAPRFGV